MIKVKELEDHSFEISWDENDPVESMMNHLDRRGFCSGNSRTIK
jgi:hypothetical protein